MKITKLDILIMCVLIGASWYIALVIALHNRDYTEESYHQLYEIYKRGADPEYVLEYRDWYFAYGEEPLKEKKEKKEKKEVKN